METGIYRLVVRRPIKLMEAMLNHFCCDARISFEGDLSQCDCRGIPVLFKEPMGALDRNTIFPRQDFIILPLEQETKDAIIKQILPRVGLRGRVLHLLIEQNGELVFAAYDRFDAVWVSSQVGEQVLGSLSAAKVIDKYQAAEIVVSERGNQ